MAILLETFSLALKINNQQLKFTIHIDDTQEDLFQKLKDIFPQCKNRRAEVLGKLKNDLKNKAKKQSVKEQLKHTIQNFIDKTFSESEENENSLTSLKKQQKSKDFLNIEGQNVNSFSKVKNPPEYCPTFKKKPLVNNRCQSNQRERAKSQRRRNDQNQDIVKACQLIFQKSNESDMKEMAKKYLQEIGRMPADQKRKKKLLFLREEVPPQATLLPPQQKTANDIDIQKKQVQVEPVEVEEKKIENDRSPIQIIEKSAQKELFNDISISKPVGLDFRSKVQERRPQIFRANKFNYMSAMQASLLPSESPLESSAHPSLRSSRGRQRRFSYLADLNN